MMVREGLIDFIWRTVNTVHRKKEGVCMNNDRKGEVWMTMGRGCVLRVLLTFTEGVSVRQVHPLCALMTSQEVTLLRVPITPITLSSSWRTMGVCVCSVSLCVCVCSVCVSLYVSVCVRFRP